MSESTTSWHTSKVVGVVVTSVAAAFFALVIQFISEVRGQLSQLEGAQSILDERTAGTQQEMQYLRNRARENNEKIDRLIVAFDGIQNRFERIADSQLELIKQVFSNSHPNPPVNQQPINRRRALDREAPR